MNGPCVRLGRIMKSQAWGSSTHVWLFAYTLFMLFFRPYNQCSKCCHISTVGSHCSCRRFILLYLSNYLVIVKHLQNNLVVSGLLLRLAEDINVPARLVGSVRGVVTLAVLAQKADLLNFLGSELDLLEVVTDARGSHRLGDDTVSTNLGPGEARSMLALAVEKHRQSGESYIT